MAKVLLATDPGPPHTHGLLRLCLEAAGHQVHEVRDGAAALAELAVVRPEVLVLDTALPSLDGLQVLARLQAMAGALPVPVLVISTIPAPLGQRLAESLGATRYLPKPFAYQALAEAVEQVVAAPALAPEARGTEPHALGAAGGPRTAPRARRSAG
jgi:two-component system OmpR family response regulator